MGKICCYKTLYLLIMVFIIASCSQPTNTVVQKLSFDELEPLLCKQNDTVYVINFWATWCKPCIKELPDFEKLNETYADKKVKVYLVSLDFPNKHEELLLPYLKKNNIKSQVIHLTDTDANSWIDKVSPLWSGSIPATLIYKGNSAEFHETTLTYEELKNIVESNL
jgi:thiol-disulfide isomerase/thioredoxin